MTFHQSSVQFYLSRTLLESFTNEIVVKEIYFLRVSNHCLIYLCWKIYLFLKFFLFYILFCVTVFWGLFVCLMIAVCFLHSFHSIGNDSNENCDELFTLFLLHRQQSIASLWKYTKVIETIFQDMKNIISNRWFIKVNAFDFISTDNLFIL